MRAVHVIFMCMKIEITREHLIRQYPDIFNQLPERLVLEGVPFAAKVDRDRVKHEKAFAALTATEWFLFKELLTGEKTTLELAVYFDFDMGNRSNTVAVHVYNMNKNFMRAKLPYRVRTAKRAARGTGFSTYKLLTK